MTKQQKILFMVNNYFEIWYRTRELVEDELSAKQSIFCICGRLATGMHEQNCSKFKNKINSETLKRLDYLKVFPTESGEAVEGIAEAPHES